MTELIQQLVNAMSLGGTYALLALGLALVFSVMRLVNFAHGELMTIAGYTMFFLLATGLPYVALVCVGVLAAGLSAIAMERVAFRPFRDADPMTLLLTSLVVSLTLQVIFQDAISARGKAVPIPNILGRTVTIGEYSIGVLQATSALITILMLAALAFLFRRTKLGINMRAATEDFGMARLMGVRANRVIATAFLLSGFLAGVAGFLWVAQRGTVDPYMGFTPVLKAFTAVIIGGLGGLAGPVAAGFLLGFVEVMLQAYLPAGAAPFRDAFVWLLVIAILLWRPGGLARGGGSRDAAWEVG